MDSIPEEYSIPFISLRMKKEPPDEQIKTVPSPTSQASDILSGQSQSSQDIRLCISEPSSELSHSSQDSRLGIAGSSPPQLSQSSHDLGLCISEPSSELSLSSQDSRLGIAGSSSELSRSSQDSRLCIAELSELSQSSQDIRSSVTDTSQQTQSSQNTGSYVRSSSQLSQPSQSTGSRDRSSSPSSQLSQGIRSYIAHTDELEKLRQEIASYIPNSSSELSIYIPSSSKQSQCTPSLSAELTRSSITVKKEPRDPEEEEPETDVEKYEGIKDFMWKSLSLNGAMRKSILQEIVEVEKLLTNNRHIQENLRKSVRDERELLKNSKPITQIRAISVFAAPYFRDSKKMVPPPNADTLQKRSNNDVNSYLTPPRPWTVGEQKKLLDGITAYALLAALQPLKRDKDFIKRKMKDKNVTDEMQEALEQELFIVEGKIKLVNHEPLKELLAQLNGKIDWMTVSATNMEGIRSPEECEVMWNNVLSFDINKRPFYKHEDAKLLDLAEEFRERNWDSIAAALQTKRTAIQCFERYQTKLSSTLKKKYWTEEEDERLLELIEEHRCGEIIPWNKISLMMDGRTRQQLMNRYYRSISQKSNRFPWTPEEDGLLIALAQKYGNRWNKMEGFFKRRSSYAIRERYCNALTPNIRVGPWSHEEDKLLISLIRKYGYGRWSRICKHIAGRTDNMCLIRAGRLLEWSIKYHTEKNTGEFDLSENTPEMYAKILRPSAPSKYCPIRNERVRAYRENGLKMLYKALEKVAPGYRCTIHDLNSIDLKWMSSEMLHKMSDVLHSEFGGRPVQERNPITPLKYVTKPSVLRKRGEPVPECEEDNYFEPQFPEQEIPREEKYWVDSALYFMFDMQSDIMPISVPKQTNYGARLCAEMSLYKAFLYKQFHCKALCDTEDDLENVVFAKVDYRETLQTVVTYFMQPPVYNNQVMVLAPNLTTMLGIETIDSTFTDLSSMSEWISQSKAYVDYLCERRESCPQCLQCSLMSGEIPSTNPKSVIEDIKEKKTFLLNKRLKDAAYIEGGSIERLSTSCTCKPLENSKKSVQLLRERFLSLFLWPLFFCSAEFNKDHEQIITARNSLDNDYYLDVETKEGFRKRKRRTVPERMAPEEPKLKRAKNTDENMLRSKQRTQLKQNLRRKKVQQPLIRKSNRSCVLNRTSFVPPEFKRKKSEVNEDLSNMISDILPQSVDGSNSPQLIEENSKQKGHKVTPKTSRVLPESEMISDIVPQSTDEENSPQLLEEKKKKQKGRKVAPKGIQKQTECEIISNIASQSADGKNALQLLEKGKKKQRGRKVTPKTSQELPESKEISYIVPQVADENDSSQFVEGKKKKQKTRKVIPKTTQKLPELEMISDSLPQSANRKNSSQSIEKNIKKQKGRKTTQKSSQELPETEKISDIAPQVANEKDSSQFLEEKKMKQKSRKVIAKSTQVLPQSADRKKSSQSVEENKKKQKGRKATQKSSHELPELEIMSDVLSTLSEENNLSQLLEEKKKKKQKSLKVIPETNLELPVSKIIPVGLSPSATMPKKKNYRSSKAVEKSIMILDDVQPSANKANDVSSLLVRQNKGKRSKPFPVNNHELSIPEEISDSNPPLANEIDSSQLQKEIISPPKKRSKCKSLKPTVQTKHKSPILIILDDLKPSVDKNNSLPNGNIADEPFAPKKRNKRKICELFSKNDSESSVFEMITDVSSSDKNGKSLQLDEKKKCGKKLRLEKQNKHGICESNPEINHKITSDDVLLLDDRNSLSHLKEENKYSTALPEKRNKRKSRTPVQKTRCLLPASEVVFDNIDRSNNRLLQNEIKREPSVLLEKLNIDVSAFLDKQNGSAFSLEKDRESASILENGKKKSKDTLKFQEKPGKKLLTLPEDNCKSILPAFINGSLAKDNEKKQENNVSSSKDLSKNIFLPKTNGASSPVKHNGESGIDTSFPPSASEGVLPLPKQKNNGLQTFIKGNSNVTVVKDGDDTAIILDEFSISSESSDSCDPAPECESVVKELASDTETELEEMDIVFR